MLELFAFLISLCIALFWVLAVLAGLMIVGGLILGIVYLLIALVTLAK